MRPHQSPYVFLNQSYSPVLSPAHKPSRSEPVLCRTAVPVLPLKQRFGKCGRASKCLLNTWCTSAPGILISFVDLRPSFRTTLVAALLV